MRLQKKRKPRNFKVANYDALKLNQRENYFHLYEIWVKIAELWVMNLCNLGNE
jgi:hypothetical protein